MKKILLLLLFLNAGFAKAQYVVNYKKVADTYFEKKDYYAAATFYKKELKITSDTAKITVPYAKNRKMEKGKVQADYEESVYRLAESTRFYRDFKESEKYYEIACGFADPKFSKACFYYGQSLRANQKFNEAIKVFEAYLLKKPVDSLVSKSKIEIQSCNFAINQMRYPSIIQYTKLAPNINGLGSNYATIQNNNITYFTSSRPIQATGKANVVNSIKGEPIISTPATPFLNTLYYSESELNVNDVEVKKLDIDLPKELEFAAPALTPSGNRIYFTAWSKNGKNTIYSAEKQDLKWINAKPIDALINSKDYNTRQPFITADGKYMLFSSDRPGGYGKFDIWFAVMRADGSFGQPINLGPQINTENNEKAPNYNVLTKSLIFSADGRVGLGGLDFFESIGDLVSWTKPINLGYPFNSSKDDVYFYATDKLGTEGFISSDRESQCCLEVFKIKREFITLSGKIIDCKTKKPLKEVNITLANSDGEKIIQTDESGNYEFKLSSRAPVKLTFEKNDYFIVTQNYSFEDLAKADTLLSKDFCLKAFKVDVPIVLENIYFEFNKADLTDTSKLVLNSLVTILNDNPELEIELSAHTDNIGTDEYNQDLSEKRAKSCVDYLILKEIAASRLTSKGYGKSMPIALNNHSNGRDNPEGRAKNRRTEFKVIKK